MEDDEVISKTNLERCSYRFLQQTAKALGLPSNVKKVYLIQLIYTSKYRSQTEVDLLVEQVRQERRHVALVRRKVSTNRKKKHAQQSTEISSTSNSLSPPIDETPRRQDHVFIRYSPETTPSKFCRNASTKKFTLNSSDRVLRSFNRTKKPSYLINTNLISLLKSSAEENKRRNETVRILSKEGIVNRTYVAKRRVDAWRNGGELVPIPRSGNISPLPNANAKRRLSGIYPLHEETKLYNVAVRRADGSLTRLNAIIQKPLRQQNYNYECTPTRNQSSMTSKSSDRSYVYQNNTIKTSDSIYTQIMTINTPSLGYRTLNMSEETQSCKSYMTETTPEKTINPKLISNLGFRAPTITEISQNLGYRTSEMSVITSSMDYRIPNNSATDRSQNNFNNSSSPEEINLSNACKENSEYSVYYHKKIRAEQVRSSRGRETAKCIDSECQLPKINEVFSRFSSVYGRDVTQPIYVQVDAPPDVAPNPPYIPEPRVQYQGGSILEKLYNLKCSYQPLLQIATTTNTRTVYSTPVISTPKAQPPSTALQNAYNYNSALRDSQPYLMNEDEEMPRVHDFFRNFHCEDDPANGKNGIDFRRSSSSLETMTSQEPQLGANVTIPEMVEDALEIISQDGDYMERMGMDVRMQCILCNWAGPKIILEYHIRKEHPSDIVECEDSEWCSSYTLGALCSRRLWLSQLLEHRATLYVLSAKYEDPDCFMAALSTLSADPDTPKTGSITVYNKVTGQPFTWQGEITQLPPSMPYENDPNCFKVHLSQLDLLPNSANLRLLNRELVVQSPTKVIVGQPELDNIRISLVVKIFD